MSLVLRDVQVDVPDADHDAAVGFWTTALGGSVAGTHGAHTHLHGLRSPVGVHVQRLEDGAGGLHLDLGAEDPEAEATRLLELGARRGGPGPCVVLLDPAGLPFCVCGQATEDEDLHTEVDQDARLQLVVLDVPSDVHEAVVRFWAAAFEVEAEPVGGAYEAYWYLGGVTTTAGTIGLLVQDIDDGDARIHLDLHVPRPVDRDREVARLLAAGAEEAGGHDHWVTLRTPGGPLVCVVPDARE